MRLIVSDPNKSDLIISGSSEPVLLSRVNPNRSDLVISGSSGPALFSLRNPNRSDLIISGRTAPVFISRGAPVVISGSTRVSTVDTGSQVEGLTPVEKIQTDENHIYYARTEPNGLGFTVTRRLLVTGEADGLSSVGDLPIPEDLTTLIYT